MALSGDKTDEPLSALELKFSMSHKQSDLMLRSILRLHQAGGTPRECAEEWS